MNAGERPIPGYELLRCIGRGGFGEVWQSTGPGGTQAALKFLLLDGHEGAKELTAILRIKDIRHPHLMPVNGIWLLDQTGEVLDDVFIKALAPDTPVNVAQLDSDRYPARVVIAMPLADQDLASRMKDCQQAGHAGIPPQELLGYMHEVAKGIDFLNTERHDLGHGVVAIQHGDIKPRNIMLVGGAAQVCDFSLAKTLSGSRSSTGQGFQGSIAYAPPECIKTYRPSPHSDQYSLAVTYCELRTGRLPFDRDRPSIAEVLDAHLSGRLNLTALPVAEQAVIRKATSRAPNQRYKSTMAMVQALRTAIKSPPVAMNDHRKRFRRRMTLLAEVVGLVCAVAIWNWQRADRDVLRQPVVAIVEPVSQATAAMAADSTRAADSAPAATVATPPVESKPAAPVVVPATPATTPMVPPAESPPPKVTTPTTTPPPVTVSPQPPVTPPTPVTTPVKVTPAPTANDPPSPPLLVAPFTASTARESQAAWAKYLGAPIEATNSLDMKLTLVPPGEFMMGTPEDEESRTGDPAQHRVTLTKGFYLSVHELTQNEYAALTISHKSFFSNIGEGSKRVAGQDTHRYPVEDVSWLEAVEFCNKLSRKENLAEYYRIEGAKVSVAGARGYRLPTEAEWEYACRAGTTTPFHFGNSLNGNEANANGNEPYGTMTVGPYLERPTTVGSYPANAFGLCDMHGNVWEWCWDGYADYASGHATDPTGPEQPGSLRVMRGGSWLINPAGCRSSRRSGMSLDYRYNYLGFRIALDLPPRNSSPVRKVEKPSRPAPLVSPFDATTARERQATWADYLGVPTVDSQNAIKLKMVLIPPGEFMIGSPPDEADREAEGAELQHRVTLTKAFYLGMYEITQDDSQQLMGTNPSWFSKEGFAKDKVKGVDTSRFPVEDVSWVDAIKFCNALSRSEKLPEYYFVDLPETINVVGGRGYRLPTEAEWEFACRAGTTTPFHFGSTLNGREANVNGEEPYGTTTKGPFLDRPANVGSYAANAFGLFDMHGNVWEWCFDWYADYPKGAVTDPTGPAMEWGKVGRGGSWNDSAYFSRAARRAHDGPASRLNNVGFRIARDVVEPKGATE